MPDGERIKGVEENDKVTCYILEYNKNKEREMKQNFRGEYLRRTKLIIKSTLNGKNKIIVMNTWAVSLMEYDAGIVK